MARGQGWSEADRLAPDVKRPVIRRGTPPEVRRAILGIWEAAKAARAVEVARGLATLVVSTGASVDQLPPEPCPECGEPGNLRGSTSRCRTKYHEQGAPSALETYGGGVVRLPARVHICQRCRQVLIEATENAGGPCEATYVVEPFRLTAAQEVAAVVAGVSTYALTGGIGRYRATPRYVASVVPSRLGWASPAMSTPADRVVVVAKHVCGRPPLSTEPVPLRPAGWPGAHRPPAPDAAPPY